MVFFWIIVFVVALIILVKGADWLIESSEKMGLALGLSPFIVGVTIVGIGTSFPELISSFVAVFQGVPEVVVANVVGSNIANILLIVGVSTLIGKRLVVSKDLIDLDLPLLATTTVLFLGVLWDAQIIMGESILLLLTYGVYFLYTLFSKDEHDKKDEKIKKPKLVFKDFFFLVLGIISLIFGAKYLIDALVQLSTILNIATGVIAITAVAVGTSLPELLVSAKAALRGKSEVALGNIFGSNVFNALVVVGLPGLFSALPVDEKTFLIGVPTMAIATLLFVISGISKKIYIWEGFFFLSIYILFVAKLFQWF